MRIALGADHGGFELKNRIKSWLAERGIETEDLGTNSADSCDYPDIARPVCELVTAGRSDRGILCCGTGIGMSIAANKIDGIRAAHVTSESEAALSRQHNDANILTLGGRTLSDDLARRIVNTWLDTAFSGDARHARRIAKVGALEQ
ncbi:MAG: ribose 5-phosphate isomerase B [Terriglobales bacterium]